MLSWRAEADGDCVEAAEYESVALGPARRAVVVAGGHEHTNEVVLDAGPVAGIRASSARIELIASK